MKWALGSRNLAKIEATESAFEKMEAPGEVVPVDVDSGISHTPMSKPEARKGAINRAKRAEQNTDANYGIGVEGYVEDGKFLSVWTVITESGEPVSEAGSGRIELPDEIQHRIPEEELGKVIEDVVGEENVKHKQGTVGHLTEGAVTRSQFTETSVIFALSELEVK